MNDDDEDENEDGSNSGGRNKYQLTKSQRTKFQMICWDFVRHIIYPHEGRGMISSIFFLTFLPSICSPFSNFFFTIVYNFQPFANFSQYFSNLFNQWPMTLIFICSIFFSQFETERRQETTLGTWWWWIKIL